MNTPDLVGRTFGQLTVLAQLGYERGRSTWYCKCSCGWFKITDSKALNTGGTTSCGCIRFTHGMSATPLHKVWGSMRERCNNPKAKSYPYYGARGIKVCDRWADFKLFLADMGPRPQGKSIERKNNDGDYEPNNCYWADDSQQQRNTRRTRLLTAGGKTRPMVEWTKLLGASDTMILQRLKLGWTEEAACLTPIR